MSNISPRGATNYLGGLHPPLLRALYDVRIELSPRVSCYIF